MENHYTFKIQGRKYESATKFPIGEEILKIAGLTPAEDYELFLKIGNKEFEPVQPKEEVDLSQPGLEMFKVRRRYEIPYELDDEFYSTYECHVTPLQLLKDNGVDPDKFYLKQIDGHNSIDYKNDTGHFISLRPNMKFITCKKGPATVSFVGSRVGVDEMERQLKDFGYETRRPEPNMVSFHFKVPHGRFAGREIEIALEASQFPNIPPPGLYITPHLLPFNSGKTLPEGGIHDRKRPDGQWQYWSRRCGDWGSSEKSMKTYLAFMRTLFDFQ